MNTYDGSGQKTGERRYHGSQMQYRYVYLYENADDYSTRGVTWDSRGNIVSVEAYYATCNYQVLYRYDYSFF